jgi:hypothetical protein
MSGATDADSGVLSGVFNTAQQVGGALGLAVLTTLATSRTGTACTVPALTTGYHLAWTAGAILAGASAVVAALALRPPAGPDVRQHTVPVQGRVAERNPLTIRISSVLCGVRNAEIR